MHFEHGESLVRERRQLVSDPYAPGRTVSGAWGDPLDYLEIADAFIASASSVSRTDAERSQVITQKSLFCTDIDVDVQPGDRIRRGGTFVGDRWIGGTLHYVHVRPEADRNPFTGWAPEIEIPLEQTEGSS